jgi:hypothetical protein
MSASTRSNDRVAFTLVAVVSIIIALGWWWLLFVFVGALILFAILEKGA